MDNDCPLAVAKLQQYIRINTAHPHPDFAGAVEFLVDYSKELEIPCKILEIVPGNPIVLMTLEGTSPEEGSILLNSHMDVVPVFEEQWDFPPFAAEIHNGKMYGRGTQDMKSVGIQHLEAIRKIKATGPLKRTIHILFVPDEEIGGMKGMGKFVESEEFRQLNIAVALDEGIPSPTEEITVCYGERSPWWLTVKATGPTGHASRFIENTATIKLTQVISKFLEFREEQRQEMLGGAHQCGKSLGDVVTVNLTFLEGGMPKQYNVIPVEAKAGFDIRVPATYDCEKLRERIRSWMPDPSVTFDFLYAAPSPPEDLMVPDNVWWKALVDSCSQGNIQTKWEIFPMATDSRYIRLLNIPAFGFSPMNHTKNLMHDHNEYIPVKVFQDGIEILRKLIVDLSSV